MAHGGRELPKSRSRMNRSLATVSGIIFEVGRECKQERVSVLPQEHFLVERQKGHGCEGRGR
jgi:hypothetical protein